MRWYNSLPLLYQVRNAMNAQMVKQDQELQEAKTAKEDLVQYKVNHFLNCLQIFNDKINEEVLN